MASSPTTDTNDHAADTPQAPRAAEPTPDPKAQSADAPAAPNVSQAERTKPSSNAPPKRPRRVRDVSPRDLSKIANAYELTVAIFDAINAHREIHERASEQHGDINPNSLLIFDHPSQPSHPSHPSQPSAAGGAGAPPWDADAHTVGALVYWEPPVSVQTLRKLGNKDDPQPPPQRRVHTYVVPPYGAQWHWL